MTPYLRLPAATAKPVSINEREGSKEIQLRHGSGLLCLSTAVALSYFAYNFINFHRTLRTSRATVAGIETALLSVEDLVAYESPMSSGGAERASQLGDGECLE